MVKADFKRLEKLGNTGQQDKKERHNIFNPKRQQSHYGNCVQYQKPIPYKHPQGAVIWVKGIAREREVEQHEV